LANRLPSEERRSLIAPEVPWPSERSIFVPGSKCLDTENLLDRGNSRAQFFDLALNLGFLRARVL